MCVLQILDLLNEKEVRLVVPAQAIVPRTFVVKPGMSLFVGGLARIDFLQVRTKTLSDNTTRKRVVCLLGYVFT